MKQFNEFGEFHMEFSKKDGGYLVTVPGVAIERGKETPIGFVQGKPGGPWVGHMGKTFKSKSDAAASFLRPYRAKLRKRLQNLETELRSMDAVLSQI